MPYKHQAHSYRTVDGVRWMNAGDTLDEVDHRWYERLRNERIRLRSESQDGGAYRRVFVHPEDMDRAMALYAEVEHNEMSEVSDEN